MSRQLLQACTPEAMGAQLGIDEVDFSFTPRFNITPGQWLAAVVARPDGNRAIEGLRWGIVPRPPVDGETGAPVVDTELDYLVIHARAETIADKPIFRDSLANRRCVVPVTGFYIWINDGDRRLPVHVTPRHGGLLMLAAVWEEWRSEDTPTTQPGLPTCAIVTTEANRKLGPFCNRMPAILRPRDLPQWLNPRGNPAEMVHLLQPYLNTALKLEVVTPQVLSPDFDDESCIQPLPDSEEILLRVGSDEASQQRLAKLFPQTRLVRRDYVAPGGQIFFKTRSFTRHDTTHWHPVVDLETGHVFCDCPDFRYRHAWSEPDVSTPEHWCKHLARAIRNCEEHGELRAVGRSPRTLNEATEHERNEPASEQPEVSRFQAAARAPMHLAAAGSGSLIL
jgi:putative SOS response-associated peptidase YedK